MPLAASLLFFSIVRSFSFSIFSFSLSFSGLLFLLISGSGHSHLLLSLLRTCPTENLNPISSHLTP